MAENERSDFTSPVQMPGLQSPTETPHVDASVAPSSGKITHKDVHFRTRMILNFSRMKRFLLCCSRRNEKNCTICLGSMQPSCGRALFTAECSHVFHFDCIASNVNHGNQRCPVCRANWKQLPLQEHAGDIQGIRSRCSGGSGRRGMWRKLVQQFYSARSSSNELDPDRYSDDEPLDFSLPEFLGREQLDGNAKVEMETHPEMLALSALKCHESFSVLIHLKAPPARSSVHDQTNIGHVPVDLVAVLDVSSSMRGKKLSLVKEAMGFVIQNLGASDRLSVVSFSSNARRLFPLRRMTDSGRLQALEDVNSLCARGTTNIADGLHKGANVLEDRRHKNAVCGIILLSDGHDNHTCYTDGRARDVVAQDMLPFSIRRSSNHGKGQIPVHTFGFGKHHDAALMHAISESSGGTFSFIEADDVIQDAFARCIGGLLSVVVQDLQVQCECVSRGVNINSIHAGSYASHVSDRRRRRGVVVVGEMYAEEERDFLVDVKIPASVIGEELVALKVGCVYKDAAFQRTVNIDAREIAVQRPRNGSSQENTVSIHVDRQKCRLTTAETLARSHKLAERGDLEAAVALLGKQREALLESAASQAGDHLCQALDEELKQMQRRLGSREEYRASGRAQMLSGMITHSTQRATTRHSGTVQESLNDLYGTSSMTSMVSDSRESQNST